jgi:predicted O-linked N-acetylglucosamine transferase (SPINDLY family)
MAAGALALGGDEAVIEDALAHHGRGDLGQASSLYESVIAARPDHAVALHNLGVIRAGEGRRDEALVLVGRSVIADPASAGALCTLGALLAGAGLADQAARRFREALQLEPGSAAALTGLAGLEADAGRQDQARTFYDQALDADAHHTPALTGLGVLLMGQGRPREAGERFALALALRPESAPAAYNVANALKALGRAEEAKAYFLKALELDPGFADALTNLGNLWRDEGDLDEALGCHLKASALTPRSAQVHVNLGHVLRDRGDATAARAAFEVALELDPDDATAALCRCMAELPMTYRDEAELDACRDRYAARLEALIQAYEANPRPEAYARAVGSSQPFYLAYQARNDRALQSRYGGFVCHVMGEGREPADLAPPPEPGERIRVGVISGFFSAHSNWKVPTSGWAKRLDRSRFEVTGYHTGVRQDASTEEARAVFDQFVQGPLGPELWRARILEDRPHVLIYPEIGMDPMAVRLAAQRLAPVQCASWGHPETSGLPTIDAFLSSELMEPEGAESCYAEQLVRLPGLGIWIEPPSEPPEMMDRDILGYRPGATVFWCGQSLPKYLPRFDDIYPRIAQKAPNSQFVFIGSAQRSEAEQIFLERLDGAFARCGLSAPDHVVMLPRMSKAQFMGAIAEADVVLDSLEWSGCNSILEGLGSGLPIVTCRGDLMRGRHAAAILEAMGLADTIADSVDSYIELAARLAVDAGLRAGIAGRIAVGAHGLYRDDRGVRTLEAFLEQSLAAQGRVRRTS